MNGKRLRAVFLLFCFALLGGCGYELVGGKGIYNGEIISLNVPVFANETFEPRVPEFFTEAFSMELAGSGLFQINTAGADATLKGTITSIGTGPAAISAVGQTVEKTVTATIGLTLTRQDKVVKRWTFGDSEVYDASSINVEDFNRRAALERIAARIARRFHSQLLAVY
jgi:outer membrane lipopolysaccharide assembly protein LptE/RlpB